MKECSICQQILDESLFRPKSRQCRSCQNEKARLYRQTEAYRQVKKKYQQSEKGQATARAREEREDVQEKRRQANYTPQARANKQKYAASDKARAAHQRAIKKYRQTQKGRLKAQEGDRRRSQTAERQAKRKIYEARYKKSAKGKMVNAKRDAKRLALMATTPKERLLTAAQWLIMLKANRYRCFYCRHKAKLTIDHVIPLSKGGQHTMENVVPACLSCNSKKHDSIVMLL